MKQLKYFLLFLNIFLRIYSLSCQEISPLCKVVRVQSEIWANEKINDTIKFIRSELWSEYNYNVTNNRRSFPDSVWVISKLMLPVTWMGILLPILRTTILFS